MTNPPHFLSSLMLFSPFQLRGGCLIQWTVQPNVVQSSSEESYPGHLLKANIERQQAMSASMSETSYDQEVLYRVSGYLMQFKKDVHDVLQKRQPNVMRAVVDVEAWIMWVRLMSVALLGGSRNTNVGIGCSLWKLKCDDDCCQSDL